MATGGMRPSVDAFIRPHLKSNDSMFERDENWAEHSDEMKMVNDNIKKSMEKIQEAVINHPVPQEQKNIS